MIDSVRFKETFPGVNTGGRHAVAESGSGVVRPASPGAAVLQTIEGGSNVY